MDVLVRPAGSQVGPAVSRTPWQTRFADLPPAPVRGGLTQVAPVAIPVVGGRPIQGRRLLRAPWAEPLAAFAGVVVETQLVPDAWLRPRSAPRRAMAPAVPTAGARPYAVVPIVSDPTARGEGNGRLIPFPVSRVAGVERPAVTAARPGLSSLGVDARAVPASAAAPIEPMLPMHGDARPAPSRRGFLGRAVVLTAGLLVSLVAFEVAARVGRR